MQLCLRLGGHFYRGCPTDLWRPCRGASLAGALIRGLAALTPGDVSSAPPGHFWLGHSAPAGARCLLTSSSRGLALLTPGYVSSAPPGPFLPRMPHRSPAPLPGRVACWRPHPGARCAHPRLCLFGPSGAICGTDAPLFSATPPGPSVAQMLRPGRGGGE